MPKMMAQHPAIREYRQHLRLRQVETAFDDVEAWVFRAARQKSAVIELGLLTWRLLCSSVLVKTRVLIRD